MDIVAEKFPDVCIGTGWYSDNERRNMNNPYCSSRFFDSDYLWKVWKPLVEKFVIPGAYILYESKCEVSIDTPPSDVEHIKGKRENVSRPYILGCPHDWGSSIMLGAQYAYCNEMDFIYFEQDCLVWGLNDAIKWAKHNSVNIAYGFGELSSWQPGWAELSFIYIKYSFIPEFLRRLFNLECHIWNRQFENTKHPEISIHKTFEDVVTYWPFGYGRLDIDWD